MKTSSSRADWLVPAALIALTIVPAIGGVIRLAGLAGGKITPENARFFAVPLPVVLHIPGALLFCILGAFQFTPGFRRRRPDWHRVAGWILVPCGLVAGLSGLWMTLFYPRVAFDSDLLDGFRLLFGSAMVLSLALGMAAILRRDIAGHRAWMIRGYAIGQGAGTQVLVSNADVKGASRLLWYEAKSLELIALMTDELAETARASAPNLSAHDIDRLERVRICLSEHLDEPPTLAELARKAGFNENKLKGGFRTLFGAPVFAYLRQLRMEEARRLLRKHHLDVSEVAQRVGYANPSKFAAAFRREFGMSPSAL